MLSVPHSTCDLLSHPTHTHTHTITMERWLFSSQKNKWRMYFCVKVVSLFRKTGGAVPETIKGHCSGGGGCCTFADLRAQIGVWSDRTLSQNTHCYMAVFILYQTKITFYKGKSFCVLTGHWNKSSVTWHITETNPVSWWVWKLKV